MRVENTGNYEVANANIEIEKRAAKTVEQKGACGRSSALIPDTPYSVTAATVEKALFSLESQLDKIKQDAKNLDLDTIKTQMAVLSNTISKAAERALAEKGYALNETDLETIVTVMDKIKVELAKGGMDIGVFGDDLSMEQLEAVTGSASQARQMALELTECQEGEIAYLVGNECEPTIENLYWAQHSGSRPQTMDTSTLPEEDLKSQIEAVIRQANLPVNETTLGYGAFLLHQEIPVTPENIAYVKELKELKLPWKESQVEAAISNAVMEGRQPQEAYLLSGYSMKDRALHAQEVITNATPEEIVELSSQGEPVTIERLSYLQQTNTGEKMDATSEALPEEKAPLATETLEKEREPFVSDDKLRQLTARRQLEEIRLVMTAQANYQLLKRGISIETLELEVLVEELKGMENQYYKQLLQGQGIASDAETAGIFQETMEKTEELKYFPSYLMGRIRIESTTLQVLYEEGSQLKAGLEQAKEAYETMMTAPRKDMGDSIQKAFRNVDDILQDLDMEVSLPNQRAVSILAYNELEISQESILRMKGADEKMQNLFQNLKPQVVMELIREGVNPLTVDITELNRRAEEIVKELDGAREVPYSEYLWEAEQNHQITPQERESYIGIYRLLRQIEKTDGAVIGAVVNQGGELSLKNLLSAVRSRKVYGTEVTVEEGFAGMTSVEEKENPSSIIRQIEAAYQTDCAKEAYRHLTPSAMQKVMSQMDFQELTPEQLLWQLKEVQQPEDERNTQRLELFSSNQRAETAVLQLLQEYEIPMDTYHIMAAGQMVNNRNLVFRKLFDGKHADKVPDIQELKEALLNKFAESVSTPEDMAEAQNKLAETAEHIMETMIEEPDITSLDVRDLKLLRTEIEISTRMSREENYFIPVMVADELTNVQLKIVRGKEKKGMVDILFDTKRLGKVAARIQVSAARVEGLVAAEQTETLKQFQQKEQEFGSSFRQQDMEVRFDFVKERNLNLTDFSAGGIYDRDKEEGTENYRVQTRQLYTAAREFLEFVKKLQIPEHK